ncbi:hypothetical protein J5N97_022573 [Dioscorea zingiberensis]|uniref:Uncharacterized protein n=1 Tax=Dioscorea zingiberensis TaxID=325984 RepID=A0A9D5CAD3_9LILI|nr:hypothetical protein J5N97_022573 [Dioscorea zingiberensis]
MFHSDEVLDVNLTKSGSVWAENLETEFFLDPFHRGPVPLRRHGHGSSRRHSTAPPQPRLGLPGDRYSLLKSNVDALHLIQIGLHLSDAAGAAHYVWEFNFKDFDHRRDEHAPKSIDLLKSNGIDFDETRARGIDSASFGLADDVFRAALQRLRALLGYVPQRVRFRVPDQGSLRQKASAEGMEEFLDLVRVFFGRKVFDVKNMMRYCEGLRGGLERVARALGVERVVGLSHQAGSDSLLTWHVYVKMKERFFPEENGGGQDHAGVLYGLEVF